MKEQSLWINTIVKNSRKKTKLTTCSNVSPSLVELSNKELEIRAANLFHDRRRLNKLGFLIIIPVRFRAVDRPLFFGLAWPGRPAGACHRPSDICSFFIVKILNLRIDVYFQIELYNLFS